MPPATSGLIRWAYEPTIAKVVIDTLATPQLSDTFLDRKGYELSPSLQYFRTASTISMGPAMTKGETTPIPFDSPGEDYDKKTPYIEVGLAFQVTRIAQEDQLTDVYGKAGINMAESFVLTKELFAARFMANANATTYYTGPDGLAIASAAHTTKQDGPTRANVPTTSSSLSYDGVKDLVTLMKRQKGKRGYAAPAITDGETVTIMYQAEDWETVTRILSALSTKLPGNNFNDPNALTATFNWNAKENPHVDVTSATGRPFMLIRGGEKSAYWVQRRPFESASDVNVHDKHVTMSGSERYAIHVEDWTSYYFNGF